jgi:hypothetical protein
MKLLIAATIPGWNDLAPSWRDQSFRGELVKALQIVSNSIANNGRDRGQIEWETLTLHYELEPSPAADEGKAA